MPHSASPQDGSSSPSSVKDGAGPLRQQLEELLIWADAEAVELRLRITRLLSQDMLSPEALPGKSTLEDLVTRLREANEHLVLATIGAQDLQTKAEEAHSRQKVFLSMLAHELRNPLAPIAMAAELLGNLRDAHPEIPMLHRIISRQTDHLTRLVDDLVDASRINSGKITVKKRRILLSQLVQIAAETSKPLLDERDQLVLIDLPVTPVIIDGDMVRLTQAFSNLLINASKFSPTGTSVRLSAHCEEDAVVVTVADEGMGIAAEIQPFIFDLFTQGPPSFIAAHGGLGIGLALVRSIVEMHGGSVSVRSAGIDAGAEFIVTLPAMASASWVAEEPGAPAAVQPVHRNILLIDDNPDINETLSSYLTHAGHTTATAADGPSGLAMSYLHQYDAVICDIGLPGMDGFDIARQLRQRTSKPLPCLIAITGYNRSDLRERADEAGFHHYLVKPVSGPDLLRLIARHPQQDPTV